MDFDVLTKNVPENDFAAYQKTLNPLGRYVERLMKLLLPLLFVDHHYHRANSTQMHSNT